MTKLKAAALAAILALAVLIPASAPAQTGGTAVPIQGNGSGSITINTVTGALTGQESGNLSHLGRYSLRLQGSASTDADGTVSGSGTVTIVAADGDQLTGTFKVTGGNGTQRVVVTITGGTGRFTNASGTLTVICVGGPPRQEGQFLVIDHNCTTKGQISY
jgi:hypothetical protein